MSKTTQYNYNPIPHIQIVALWNENYITYYAYKIYDSEEPNKIHYGILPFYVPNLPPEGVSSLI